MKRQPPPFKPDQESDICTRYLAGESARQIAISHNRSLSTITRCLLRHDVALRDRRETNTQNLSVQQRDEIVERYLNGENTTMLATEFGSLKSGIKMILNRRGIKLRNRGSWQTLLPRLTVEQKDEVCSRYLAGETSNEIAARFGVCQVTISKFLLRCGVPVRPSMCQRIKQLAATGELGRMMSARAQGVPLDEWQGFTKPAWQRFMGTDDYKAWRKTVYARDNYSCRLCGQLGTGSNLHAHHIFMRSTYPHLTLEVANGITLCKSCHTPLRQHEQEHAHEFLRIIGSTIAPIELHL